MYDYIGRAQLVVEEFDLGLHETCVAVMRTEKRETARKEAAMTLQCTAKSSATSKETDGEETRKPQVWNEVCSRTVAGSLRENELRISEVWRKRSSCQRYFME